MARSADAARAADPSVAGFLKAHAALAINDNNTSYCTLATLQNPQALAAWTNWTKSFASRFPDAAVSHYFRGDALTRTGDADAGMREFDRAVSINRKHVLALNARGLVRTLQGRYDDGLQDFTAAAAANRNFADVNINRGFLYSRSGGSGSSQLRAFDAALASNARATLAIIGRAQALVATGKRVAGLSELDDAPKNCPTIQALVDLDRSQLFLWAKANSPASAAGLSAEEAGTTLTTLLKDLAQNRDVTSAKKVMDFVAGSGNADLQKKATMTFQSMERTDKEMGAVIGQAINEKKMENETLRSDLLKQGSQKTSSEADVGLEFKGGGLKVGGSAKASTQGDLKAYADQQLQNLQKNETFTDKMDSTLNSGKQQAGGAETMLIGLAQVERGDSPRFHHDGLLYGQALRQSGGRK